MLSPNVILLLPIEERIFMLSFPIASCGYAHMLYTVGSPRTHATWIWVLRAYPKVWIPSCPFLDWKVLGARSRVQFFLTVPISSLLVVYSRSSYLAHHRASMNVEQMNWFFSHKYHTTHLPIPMLDVDEPWLINKKSGSRPPQPLFIEIMFSEHFASVCFKCLQASMAPYPWAWCFDLTTHSRIWPMRWNHFYFSNLKRWLWDRVSPMEDSKEHIFWKIQRWIKYPCWCHGRTGQLRGHLTEVWGPVHVVPGDCRREEHGSGAQRKYT